MFIKVGFWRNIPELYNWALQGFFQSYLLELGYIFNIAKNYCDGNLNIVETSAILNVILFSVYHFWSPWLIVTRIIAMFPLYYFVYKKNLLKLAILVHCLANFTDVTVLITLL